MVPTGARIAGAASNFLGEHQIPYQWINIEEDQGGEERVLELNRGKRIIPTIVFKDGSFLTEPSNAELAEKLGLKTVASKAHYDLIVLGGGPAGLTAALYAAREAIDTLVIERAAFGGQASGTEKLDNMPGFPEGVAGIDFSDRLRTQAERFGVELLQAQEVKGMARQGSYPIVTTGDGSEYSCKALLIATGSRYRRLGVPGESDYSGAGVHFCATCDGPFYKGKRVAVIGGGNSATEESLLLTKFAKEVTIFVRKGEFKASAIIRDKVLGHPGIQVRWHTEVVEFLGEDSKLNALKVIDNLSGETEVLPIDGAFIFIGLVPNSAFIENSGILRDPWGFIITGHGLTHHIAEMPEFEGRPPALLETSLPGVFAAGDVRDTSTKQVVSAAGEGSAAALLIREYLRHH